MNSYRKIAIVALALSVSVGVARAQDLQARIIDQLEAQGFERVEISRTWLGRVRIDAHGPVGERQIVYNPNTGEILRDYWQSSENEGSGLFTLSPDGQGEPASGEDQGDDPADDASPTEPDRDNAGGDDAGDAGDTEGDNGGGDDDDGGDSDGGEDDDSNDDDD